jgi:hypothetical protein
MAESGKKTKFTTTSVNAMSFSMVAVSRLRCVGSWVRSEEESQRGQQEQHCSRVVKSHGHFEVSWRYRSRLGDALQGFVAISPPCDRVTGVGNDVQRALRLQLRLAQDFVWTSRSSIGTQGEPVGGEQVSSVPGKPSPEVFRPEEGLSPV